MKRSFSRRHSPDYYEEKDYHNIDLPTDIKENVIYPFISDEAYFIYYFYQHDYNRLLYIIQNTKLTDEQILALFDIVHTTKNTNY